MSICLLFKGISFRGMKRHNRNKKEYACIIILSIYVPSGKKIEKSSAITEDRTVVIEGGGGWLWLALHRAMRGGESQCRNVIPIDPNPVVYPQSGRSPEKWQFYHIFPHFSKREPSKSKKYRVQYIKLKTTKCCFKYKRNDSVLIKWWS